MRKACRSGAGYFWSWVEPHRSGAAPEPGVTGVTCGASSDQSFETVWLDTCSRDGGSDEHSLGGEENGLAKKMPVPAAQLPDPQKL